MNNENSCKTRRKHEENEEVEAEKQGKRAVVQDQTHLRENKREEVKLYHVVNSRVENKKEKKEPKKTGDEGRKTNGWGK